MPSGPHFMGIAVRQRIAPTGAFAFGFFAAPAYLGVLASTVVQGDAHV